MFRFFEGRTADETWQRIASVFRERNDTHLQSSRAGDTYELLHTGISVENPRQRWISSRRPPLNPAYALAEIVWIMTGRNDSAFLNYFNTELPKFAGLGDTYYGAYGYRLRTHFGLDQLERAYEALKHNPNSRQVVLEIWDGKIDLPGPKGQESSTDVPCNLLSMLKVRHSKLEWLQIMRSSDIYRGLPYDIVQFSMLQEIIAGWLGLELGSYNHVSDSLHLYTNCLNYIIDSAPTEVMPNNDSLELPKQESEQAFRLLACNIETIIDISVPPQALIALAVNTPLPQAYRNMLYILCAEGLRRRRESRFIDKVMGFCTNPAYSQLYCSWLARFSSS